MKIVYISNLAQAMTGGPKYSVPKQIKSQSRYDDVTWINTSQITGLDESICQIIVDAKSVIDKIVSIDPDLVVFEEVYYFVFVKIYKKLVDLGIKYVIVPRGCLTKYAQKRKRVKKIIANLLFFRSFCKKAAAIQYLCTGEYESSGKEWNKSHIILPNGIDRKQSLKKDFSGARTGPIKAIFIGRVEIVQKGVDVFLDACAKMKDIIVANNVQFSFYGPVFERDLKKCTEIINSNGLANNIFFRGEIYGKNKETALLDSDFFFLTSRFEGLPMGILDALSYGIPVLATTQTNMGDTISEHHAGFSSDCNPSGIKECIQNFIELDEAGYKLLSKNALELSKKYIWEEIAQSAHGVYDSIIQGRR